MRSVLSIIPFSFYPPVTGGALRCFHLVTEMSKHYNISIITVQPNESFYNNGIFVFPKNVKIFSINKSKKKKSSSFNHIKRKLMGALFFRYIRRSFKGSTNQFLLDAYITLKSVLMKSHFDVILFENLEAVTLTSDICNRLSPRSLKIYDAHNVDSILWKQIAISQNNKLYQQYQYNALTSEKQLHKRIDSFFCCSSIDYNKLLDLNKSKISGTVIPNGVDVDSKAFDYNVNKFAIENIIFCGTLDTVPNKEGLLWFYNNVFPLIKELRPKVLLTVIGRVTNKHDFEKMINDPSINFIGNVEDVTTFYKNSSVAIVPLLSGSGTRLKILEAMSFGNAVVSTSTGAEGIECTSGKNIFIADQPDIFAQRIDSLLGAEILFNKIRFEALELVKTTYDWKVIGTKLNEALKSLLDNEIGEGSRG